VRIRDELHQVRADYEAGVLKVIDFFGFRPFLARVVRWLNARLTR
jgi:hypothetical protein